jgi:predicted TIM-barrel fold metal-dependent hydrolase
MENIDFHVHITPPDIIADWRRYAEKETYFSLLSESPHNKFACAEDIVAAMKKDNFARAVVFGFGFKDMGLCRYVNDYVIEKTREYRELTGFISVAPNSAEAPYEIERCCGAGLMGIGEIFPEGQGFNPEEKNETREFAEACLRFNIPVIIHTNEPVGHYYAGKTNTSLQTIEKFIENNPDLKIVLAHWGGGLLFYEAMPEMRKKLKNVYYDTAAMPFLYDRNIYRAAAALGLCDKILFGSDFPLLPPSRYFKELDKSGISPEEKQLILAGNALRILSA